MNESEWTARLKNAECEAYGFMDEISKKTGYEYKKIVDLKIFKYKDCPSWHDGKVEIGYNNDPEFIAHEIGHGLHEKIRETGKQDFLGEEFAEAIRFYVEQRICSDSQWLKTFKKEENSFVKNYDCPQFIRALKDGSLFDEVEWR